MTAAMNQFVADEELAGWLGELRLPYIRAQLPNLLTEAADADLNLRDFLIMLCRHERESKRRQRLLRHLKQARFPMQRSLSDFDFTAQPSINPDQVHDLATARWIVNGENVLLLGPPGVGKTHLAIGLGHAATDADCSVLFVTAQTLMVQLHQAHENGAWDACLARFVKPKLLIIDEFGYLPVPPRTHICCFNWLRRGRKQAASC